MFQTDVYIIWGSTTKDSHNFYFVAYVTEFQKMKTALGYALWDQEVFYIKIDILRKELRNTVVCQSPKEFVLPCLSVLC